MVCPFAFLVLLPGAAPTCRALLDGSMAARMTAALGCRLPFILSLLATIALLVPLKLWSGELRMEYEARLKAGAFGGDSGELVPFWTPDATFGKGLDEVEEWLEVIGGEGRQIYRKIAILDLFAFTVAYNVALASAIGNLLGVVKGPLGPRLLQSAWRHVQVFPVGSFCLDVLETTSFLYSLTEHPGRIEMSALRAAVPLFNMGKWAFVGASLLCILALAGNGLAAWRINEPKRVSQAPKKEK